MTVNTDNEVIHVKSAMYYIHLYAHVFDMNDFNLTDGNQKAENQEIAQLALFSNSQCFLVMCYPRLRHSFPTLLKNIGVSMAETASGWYMYVF